MGTRSARGYFAPPAAAITALSSYLLEAAGRQAAERQRLLHTVIIGGGPTGVEFAGELSDFISKDLAKVDNDRARDMQCARLHGSIEHVLMFSDYASWKSCHTERCS